MKKVVDRDTNPLQREAVEKMVTTKLFHPFLVFGPPGTGKTKTMIEALLQLLDPNADSGFNSGGRSPLRILASAPSDAACDLICHRVALYLESEREQEWYSGDDRFVLVRLNSRNRDFDFVSHKSTILRYCTESPDSGLFDLPAGFLHRPRIQSKPLLIVATPVAAPADIAFDYIFLDESSQANVLESVMLFSLSKAHTNMILLGDPCQLGPQAHQETFGTTLHETLQRQYLAVPSAKQSYLVKLLQNYRSHPSILGLFSTLYYEDELQACASQSIFLGNPGVTLVGHVGTAEKEFQVISIAANQCMHQIPEATVCCIAPYREQVVKLRRYLRKHGLGDINVGSVHDFQGQERDIVVVSTHGVRDDYRLVNVAISRAKSMLVIVGNTYELCNISRDWVKVIKYIRSTGTLEGQINTLQFALNDIRTRPSQRFSLRAHLAPKRSSICLTVRSPRHQEAKTFQAEATADSDNP